MKLWQYIKGPRKGKEAHQIELEAMKDPFLADALEGYEKAPGNHQKEVAKIQKEVTWLQKRITNRTIEKKTNHLKIWSIAASILIVAGIGTWFVLDIPQQNQKDTTTAIEEDKKAVPPITGKVAKGDVVSTTSSSTVHPETVEVMKVVEETPAVALSRNIEADSIKPSAPEATPEKKETVTPNSPDAQPVVGMEAYKGYLQRNLNHPTDEECRNVKGNVVVVFKVGQSGRPYNIRVEQGLCASINKEAIRLIINGPDWKKGINSDEAKVTIIF